MRKIIAAASAVLACAACGHAGRPDPVATTRRVMVAYCAQRGELGIAWSEIDSDGRTNVYGRCVQRDGDIARGA